MSGPQNASSDGEGFRWYEWAPADGGPAHRLLSVTTVRKLCGTQYMLVNWQLGNLLDTVMGTVKRPAIGKRGKPLKGKYVYVPEENPSEFMRRYSGATKQEDYDALRRWVRETADHPRNIAAIRGTITHAAVERNVAWDRIERPWVEAEFANLSQRERNKAKKGVLDEDVRFVRRSVANYWDMRAHVPYVVIAREPQVFNLEMGYGGSADNIIWFLPEGLGPEHVIHWQRQADLRVLTLATIQSIGGFLAVGDVKTSKGIYTDQVVQVHAYGAGEFVGRDGVVDHRLTDILQATQRGVLLHLRPEHWAVHVFDFSEPVFRAFAGSVAFARFLFEYPNPEPLFLDLDQTGTAPEEE